MDFRKITDLLNLTTPYKEETLVKPTASDSEETKNFIIKREPAEELMSWSYDVPPYKIPKRLLRSGFVFTFLFCIFLVLAQDWFLLLVILSFVFLINLLSSSKVSRRMDYKIYSNGFDYSGTFYSWEELNQFFYYEGTDNQIAITSKDPIPGRMYVYFKEGQKEEIDSLLSKYLSKNLVHPKDFYEIILFKIKPLLNLSDEK